MDNTIGFEVQGRKFVIYQAPALELVDLILAVQELGEMQGEQEVVFKINRKNYKEFASLLLQTTFIVEKLSDGTESAVSKSSFVGLKDTQMLMEFISKVIEILMEAAAPMLTEVNEKKTESTNFSKKRKKPIITSISGSPGF